MSRKLYSTASPPPVRRAIAQTSNHSQDSKFRSGVSASSTFFPDSSSSSQLMPQNRKQAEEDFSVPIIYEGGVLPLHSSKKEILEDTPIQKNNYNPINDAKFPHAGVPHARKVQFHGSNEDMVSPKVHASATQNGKARNGMMVSKLNVPNTAAMEKTSDKKMAQSSVSEPVEENIDEKFKNFIDRAKLKIRSVSNIGGEKSGKEKDTVNGRFTDYINHAKLRLRTTSSISEGKNFPKTE